MLLILPKSRLTVSIKLKQIKLKQIILKLNYKLLKQIIMKTKIFLPVLAMISLMLFSFTTNNTADYSVRILADGNYELRNVPVTEEDEFRMNNITQNLTVSQRIAEMGDEALVQGLWVNENETWDEDKSFTKKKKWGLGIAAQFGDEYAAELHHASIEIHRIMENYMR